MLNNIKERCSEGSCKRCGMMNRKRLMSANLWIAMRKVTTSTVRLRLLLWQDNHKPQQRSRRSFNLHLKLKNQRKHLGNSRSKCLTKTILPQVLTHRKTNSTRIIILIQLKELLLKARSAYLPSTRKAECIHLIKTLTSNNKFTTEISIITNSSNNCPIRKIFSMLALIREKT